MTKWQSLPTSLKIDPVRPFYEALAKKRCSLFFKRCFDIFFSLILILLLSPVMLFLAVWIKADSRGPVFFRSERITQYGRPFKIFKFRTMVSDADKIGAAVTVANDSRITRVGAKIRHSRLDEIPQLFNVLLGDMSFVGTRPEAPKYVEKYTDEMKATLLMRAGITSTASIAYKDEDRVMKELISNGTEVDDAYINHVLPDKMRYNLEYIKNFTFLGDIKICFKTIF